LNLVPRVACIRIAGLRLWFISGDHEPPHFHAEKAGEWGVKVSFLLDESEMYEVVWTVRAGRPGRRDLRKLTAEVLAHRPRLFEEGRQKVNVGRAPEGDDP
jgi:Domain of unknown function (DUF4160)